MTTLIDIPEYAKGDQDLWTPTLVKDALVDAFRMLRRTGGRVGPAHLKAFWPEHQIEQADFVQQSIHKTLREKRPAPTYRTRMTVTRMEMVLLGWKDEDGRQHPAWLEGQLRAVPDLRGELLEWIKADLRGESSTDLCLRKGWALSTFKRHRDRAAGIIARRLNILGVQPW